MEDVDLLWIEEGGCRVRGGRRIERGRLQTDVRGGRDGRGVVVGDLIWVLVRLLLLFGSRSGRRRGRRWLAFGHEDTGVGEE